MEGEGTSCLKVQEIIAMKRHMGQIAAHMKKINVLSASEGKQNSSTKCAWNLPNVWRAAMVD